MAKTDEPNSDRQKESQESAEEQAREQEQESAQIFELAEDSGNRDSDTSILKKADALSWDDALEDHVALVGDNLSDTTSAEGEGDLELPEDELVDLPVSQNFRLVSTTDLPEGGVAPKSVPTPPAPEPGEELAIGLDTSEVAQAHGAEFSGRETLGASPSFESQQLLGEETTQPPPGSGATETPSSGLAEGSSAGLVTEEVSPADRESAGEKSPEGEPSGTPVAGEEVLLVRLPDDERWIPLSELIVKTTGEAIGPAAARWMTRLYLKSLEKVGDAPAVGEFLPEGALPEAEAPREALVFPRFETAPGEADYRERVRKGRPSKSLLRELVGIVLGGVCGLLIAYYALNYFGGKRYDFANIPLPGIPHTYHHLPSWAKGWFKSLTPGQSAPDTGRESPDEGR